MQYRYLLHPHWNVETLDPQGPTFHAVGDWKESIDEALKSILRNQGGGHEYLMRCAWVERSDGMRYVKPLQYVQGDFWCS